MLGGLQTDLISQSNSSLDQEMKRANLPIRLLEEVKSTSVKSSTELELIHLRLNQKPFQDLRSNHKAQIVMELPWFEGNTVQLELTKYDILSQDYYMETSSGDRLESSEIFTYRGTIDGHKGVASFVISNDKIRGLFSINDINYQLTKVEAEKDLYALFDIAKAGQRGEYSCSALDIPGSDALGIKTDTPSTKSSTAACVPLYIESDYTTFLHFNKDLVQIEAYIHALINEVILLYEQEGISLTLSRIHITTSQSEDYTSIGTNAQEVLEIFAERRKNHFFGRLAHFITVRNLIGGAAWLGTFCSDYDTFEADLDGDGIPETHHYGPYAVSSAIGSEIYDLPIYSWDVFVFAHELGHNLGSPHTHACAWGPLHQAIDNCVPTEGGCGLVEDIVPSESRGTIMSYCHLTSTGIDFSKGLGRYPGDLIRSLLSTSSCALSCDIEEVAGCFDSTKHDYNPYATIDSGVCEESCDDGQKNGDETGVDCGGSLCEDCREVCDDYYLKVQLVLDAFPSETTWLLIDSLSGDTLGSGGPYPTSMAYDTLISEYCVSSTTVAFIVTDMFGDGICCQSGSGSYSLINDQNITISSGGDFLYSETRLISLAGESSDCPNSLLLADMNLAGTYLAHANLQTLNSRSEDDMTVLQAKSIDIEGFTVSQGSVLEVYAEACQE